MTATETSIAPKPWKTAFLAGMASYLDAGAIVATGTALVLYAPTLALNEWDIGALSALLTLCFATGALFGGRLGDRFGRRRVFTVTLLVFAIGVAILALAVAPIMLYIGVVITGFAIGSDLPVSLALAAEEAPEGSKGKMVALSGVIWFVGIGVVVVLGIFVGGLGELGARILYGQLLLVALVVLVLRSRMKESREWTIAHTASLTLAASGSRTGGHGRSTGGDGGQGGEERIDLGSLRRLLSPPLLSALVATGLFYAIWNIGANTLGQFSAFLYVAIAGSDVPTASFFGLLALPIGIGAGLAFMRVVDRPSRLVWFTLGFIASTIAFAVPLVFGVSVTTLAVMGIVSGIGIGFAGETIYKVWTQELFPTLVRSTAQGATIAVTRYVAAAVALFTPAIATSNTALLFLILIGSSLISGLIGLFWIARLPKALTAEEEAQVIEARAGAAAVPTAPSTPTEAGR